MVGLRKTALTPALPMNRKTGTGGKTALTPALSPGEREKRLPRPDHIMALDLRWFRGAMRELLRGNLSPFCFADYAKRGEGETFPVDKKIVHGMTDAVLAPCAV